MIPWQSIEAAPHEYGTEVLLWMTFGEDEGGPGYYIIGMWGPAPELDGDECWIHPEDHYWLGEPTHWAPLNPPEQAMNKAA